MSTNPNDDLDFVVLPPMYVDLSEGKPPPEKAYGKCEIVPITVLPTIIIDFDQPDQ